MSRNIRKALSDVRETHTDVREWSRVSSGCLGVVGGPYGYLGVVGRPSRMFLSSREALPDDWYGREALSNVRSGRETLLNVPE